MAKALVKGRLHRRLAFAFAPAFVSDGISGATVQRLLELCRMLWSSMMDERDMERLLLSYPRKRPPLSAAHQAVYVDEYRSNRLGSNSLSSLVATLESWMHRAVARPDHGPLLEIGAGTLNHVPYEPNVEAYDVVEPFHELCQDSPHRARVREFYDDCDQVPEDRRYVRIISVAVLEHLEDLPGIVARSALLLSSSGEFCAGIPSESGMLWGLAWRLTTGLAYRFRTGLDYATVMRHEHINSDMEIVTIVKHFFGSVNISRYPMPFHHLSFYTAIEARDPRLERCRAFLETRSANPTGSVANHDDVLEW